MGEYLGNVIERMFEEFCDNYCKWPEKWPKDNGIEGGMSDAQYQQFCTEICENCPCMRKYTIAGEKA